MSEAGKWVATGFMLLFGCSLLGYVWWLRDKFGYRKKG